MNRKGMSTRGVSHLVWIQQFPVSELVIPVFCSEKCGGEGIKGAVAHGVSSFPNIFLVASLCSFICLQAVYQLSGAVCKATWNGYPSYSLLTFISHFVD